MSFGKDKKKSNELLKMKEEWREKKNEESKAQIITHCINNKENLILQWVNQKQEKINMENQKNQENI